MKRKNVTSSTRNSFISNLPVDTNGDRYTSTPQAAEGALAEILSGAINGLTSGGVNVTAVRDRGLNPNWFGRSARASDKIQVTRYGSDTVYSMHVSDVHNTLSGSSS